MKVNILALPGVLISFYGCEHLAGTSPKHLATTKHLGLQKEVTNLESFMAPKHLGLQKPILTPTCRQVYNIT